MDKPVDGPYDPHQDFALEDLEQGSIFEPVLQGPLEASSENDDQPQNDHIKNRNGRRDDPALDQGCRAVIAAVFDDGLPDDLESLGGQLIRCFVENLGLIIPDGAHVLAVAHDHRGHEPVVPHQSQVLRPAIGGLAIARISALIWAARSWAPTMLTEPTSNSSRP